MERNVTGWVNLSILLDFTLHDSPNIDPALQWDHEYDKVIARVWNAIKDGDDGLEVEWIDSDIRFTPEIE